MAVVRITKDANDWEYAGYSGDVKPTSRDGRELRNGTGFREIDTGKRYIFYAGAWEDDLTLIYAIAEGIRQQSG